MLAWKSDGELRTRQVCQATAQHPRSGDWVWFNQAHLFHVSNLEAGLRETLLSVVDEIDLPRNVYYGDGGAIEESVPAIVSQLKSLLRPLRECEVIPCPFLRWFDRHKSKHSFQYPFSSNLVLGNSENMQ